MKTPVTWFSIPSDDIEASARFYEQALGWELLPETKEDNEVFNYRVAPTPRATTNLFLTKEAGSTAAS